MNLKKKYEEEKRKKETRMRQDYQGEDEKTGGDQERRGKSLTWE